MLSFFGIVSYARFPGFIFLTDPDLAGDPIKNRSTKIAGTKARIILLMVVLFEVNNLTR